MSEQLLGIIIGAGAAILGGVIGGFVQGVAWYRFELRRAAREEKKRWIEIALEWAAKGRRESLLRVDLEGADLRGIDLTPGEGQERGADLSYANLSGVNLCYAQLAKANLSGADLREANLGLATLTGAILSGADLRGALLGYARLDGAILGTDDLKLDNLGRIFPGYIKYDDSTVWPDDFTPPQRQ